MKSLKRMLLVLCLLSMLVHQQANAQALLQPVENYVVNRAVAGIIANRIALAEGVAANDAVWLSTKAANDSVYKATMSAVSSQMTAVNVAATVAGGALAIMGAPVWLTIAAGLGITALGAYFVSQDASQKVSVLQSSSSVVIQTQSIPSKVSYSTPSVAASDDSKVMKVAGAIALGAGLVVYRDVSPVVGDDLWFSFPAAPSKVTQLAPYYAYYDGYIVLAYSTVEVKAFLQALVSERNRVNLYGTDTSQVTQSVSSVSVIPLSGGSSADLYWTYSQTIVTTNTDKTTSTTTKTYTEKLSYWSVLPSAVQQTYTNLTDAYKTLTDAQKAIPVPASMLAKIADEAWRRAAQQTGYQGLPYSATQPISASDVTTWQSANPTAMPTLGDMLRPAQNQTTDTNGVPISLTVTTGTNTGSNTGTTTNPGTSTGTSTNPNAQVNLGPDPGVADPTLEDTPDAATILNPLTSLFPELRSFQTPGHGAECPKPQFEVFGKTLVMDAQCTIAEQHRAAIGAVMLAVWILVGLFILLSA